MKRLLVLLIIAVLGASVLLISRAYTPELVNFVVCQAYLQKMPKEYSADTIRKVFNEALRKSKANPLASQQYLEKLFAVSQKLEKIQHLSMNEAAEILEQITKAGPQGG
jgi:hypothetical protein